MNNKDGWEIGIQQVYVGEDLALWLKYFSIGSGNLVESFGHFYDHLTSYND